MKRQWSFLVAVLISSAAFCGWIASQRSFIEPLSEPVANTATKQTDSHLAHNNDLSTPLPDSTLAPSPKQPAPSAARSAPSPTPTVSFSLPNGHTVEGDQIHTRYRTGNVDDWTSRFGSLTDGGEFVVSRRDDAYAGFVLTGIGERFEFNSDGSLKEVDAESAVDCASCLGIGGSLRIAPPAGAKSGTSEIEPSPETSQDAGTTLDVMIVYTAAARNGAGGASEIQARIEASISTANLALINSNIDAEFRLVHTQEISYTESGNILTDLERLQRSGDGHLEDVHTLRNTYGADLVSLYTQTGQSGVAGIGYIMSSSGEFFSNWSFSVVRQQYASFVLGHEMGHNLGCAHDRDNATDGGLLSDSYGHVFDADSRTYGTMMSYPGITVAHYSDPDVRYHGVPTGVAAGEPDSANNAGTIRTSAPMVASFKSTQVVSNEYILTYDTDGSGTITRSPVGTNPFTPDSGGLARYDAGTLVTITANPGAGAEFVQWIGSVSNTTSETTTISMNADQELVAVFQQETDTLNWTSIGTGTIQRSPLGTDLDGESASGSSDYATSTVVTVTAVPGDGWEFAGWSGSVSNAASEITTVSMTQERWISATFNRINVAPTVNAGADRTIWVYGAPAYVHLAGSVSDDGLPNGTTTAQWSRISGPTTVQYADSTDPESIIRFPSTGTYTLRLTASDGQYQVSDDVIYTIGLADAGSLDNDGMPEQWEIENNLDPTIADSHFDPDNDGLTNGEEYLAGTHPLVANDRLADFDNDGIPDEWENAHGMNSSVNDANGDLDGDGISNRIEYLNGTDPELHNQWLTDSDGDGMPDDWEVANGLDPNRNDANEDADANGQTNLNGYLTGSSVVDTIAPDALELLSAAAGDGYAVLQWTPSSASDFDVYRLYRSSSVIDSTNGLTAIVEIDASATTTYTDNGATNGAQAFYAIEVVDRSGNAGSIATSLGVTPAADAPSPVEAVAATGSATGNTITWSILPDADHYRIYVSTSPISSTANATLVSIITEISQSEFIHTPDQDGVLYYAVTAVTEDGHENTSALYTVGVDEIVPETVQAIAARSANGQITLSWNPSNSSDVVEYRIYTSTGSGYDAGFSVGLQTSYLITNLSNDVTYTFKVSAVDGSGNEEAGSTISAKPAATRSGGGGGGGGGGGCLMQTNQGTGLAMWILLALGALCLSQIQRKTERN